MATAAKVDPVVQAIYDEITNQSKFLKSDKAFAGPTKKGQSSGKMASTDEVRMDFARKLAAKGVTSISQLGLKQEPTYTTYEVRQVTDPIYGSPAFGEVGDQVVIGQSAPYWAKVIPDATGDTDGTKIRLTAAEIKQLTVTGTTKRLTQQTGTKNVVYNTKTGAVLGDANEGGSWKFGSTSKGDGITSYMVNFTPDGLPIFYGATKPTGLGELMSDLGPIADIAKVGLAFVPGGQPFAMAIQGLQTLAAGGDITKLLGDLAKTYIASEIGGKVGSYVGDAAKASESLTKVLGAKGAELAVKATTNFSSAVTRAAILGQDVDKAAIGALAGTAGDFALAGLNGQDWYKNLSPAAKSAVDTTVKSSVAGAVTGKNVDFGAVVKEASLAGALTYVKQQLPAGTYDKLPASSQKYVETLLTKAVTGNLTDKALTDATMQMAVDYIREAPQREAAEKLEAAKTSVLKDEPNFDTAFYKSMYGLKTDAEAYAHYLTEGASKGLVTNKTQYDNELASILGVINDPLADPEDLTEAVKNAGIPTAKIEAALGDGKKTIADYTKQIDERLVTGTEATELWKSAGFTGEPSYEDVVQMLAGNESTATQYAKGSYDARKDLYDANTAKDVDDAAQQAAKAGQNKFVFDGNIYTVTQPKEARESVKQAKTFGEAYAQARESLGAGKTFEWNGKLYSTLTKEEAPFDGSKYGDKVAAAVAANQAGKTSFTYGGKTYSLSPDFAKLSGPDQSPAETARMLRLNKDVEAAYIKADNEAQATKSLAQKTYETVTTGVKIAANNLTGIAARGAGWMNAALGNDFDAELADKVQTVIQKENNRSLEELSKDPNAGIRAVAGGVASGVTSAVAFLVGGPYAALATNVGITANQEWVKGAEAGLSVQDNAIRTSIMSALEAAGEAISIPALNTIMKGIPLTGSVDEILSAIKKQAAAHGNEQVAEFLTFTGQYAADKILATVDKEPFTFSEYVDGVVNTAISTLAAVGTSSSIASATNSVKAAIDSGSSKDATPIYGNSITGTPVATTMAPAGPPLNTVYEITAALESAGLQGASATDIARFTTTDPVTLNAEALAYADPRVTDAAEARQMLADLGYTNPTDAEVNQFVGQKAESIQRTAAEQYADPRVTDAAEARQMLEALGYKPTDAEVQKFVGQAAEANQKTAIGTYVDPLMTDAAEAKAMLEALGYKPTDAEVQKFVGQVAEANQKTAIGTYVDPLTTDPAEARAMLEALGYKPTDAEVQKFVGQTPEATQKTAIGTYVDPLMTDPAEARAMLEALGYKDPTFDEIIRFAGATPEATQKTAIGTYVDPLMTDAAEAKAMLEALGYNPTDAEVQKFVGQVAEADQKTAIGTYVDPLMTDAAEAKAMLEALGYTNPTDAEVNQFVGQKAESTQRTAAEQYAAPRVVTEAEARQMLADLGYTTPTTAEVKQFAGAQNDQNFQSTQQKAIEAYADPRVTDVAEARQMLVDLGYTNPTDAEVNQFVGQKAESDQKVAIENYVDPKVVDAEEVKAAYANLGLKAPTQADIDALVGQYAETELAGKAEANLDDARFNYLSQQIEGGVGSKEVLSDVQAKYDSLTAEQKALADALEAQGVSLSDAITAAQEQLAGQIGEVSADVQAKYDSLTAEQKALADALEAQGVSLSDAITAAQEQLAGQIGEVSADVQAKYDSLTAEQKALADALTQQGLDLNSAIQTAQEQTTQQIQDVQTGLQTQIGNVESNLGTQIGNVQSNLDTRVQELMKAGADQWTATQQAISEASGALSSQIKQGQMQQVKTDLMSKLGQAVDMASQPTTINPIYGTMEYADLYESPFAPRAVKTASAKPPSETKMAGGGVVDPFAEPQSWDDFYRMLR